MQMQSNASFAFSRAGNAHCAGSQVRNQPVGDRGCDQLPMGPCVSTSSRSQAPGRGCGGMPCAACVTIAGPNLHQKQDEVLDVNMSMSRRWESFDRGKGGRFCRTGHNIIYFIMDVDEE